MTKSKWTRQDLQRELARRAQFPASTDLAGWTRLEPASLAELRSELQMMPLDHPRWEWREWELALATEHYRLTPDVPFMRCVDVVH